MYSHTDDMDETQEQPSTPEHVVSPELRQSMETANSRIQAEAQAPQADIVERTAHMGLFSALLESQKSHGKKMLEIQFKNVKVAAMAALSLVPFLGEGASAARAAEKVATLESSAAKQLANPNKLGKYVKTQEKLGAAKAAYKAEVGRMKSGLSVAEKARLASLSKNAELKGLGQHVGVQAAKLEKGKYKIFKTELGKNIDAESALFHAKKGIDTTKTWAPLGEKTVFGKKVELPTGKWKFRGRMAGEQTAFGMVESALHTLDPYPDVPGVVSMFGLLEIVGVHGAELAPAAWQFVANKAQMVKEYAGMGKDAAKIVLSRMGMKFDTLKEGRVQRAAEAFIPTPKATPV